MHNKKLNDVLESFGIDLSKIDENARLSSFGIDSLITMDLILRLESAIGKNIPDEMLTEENIKTVASLRKLMDYLSNSEGNKL
jgi:acyl carrier protein